MHLIALYPVIHHTIMYQVGDELPTDDTEMVNLWLENSVAKKVDVEEDVSVLEHEEEIETIKENALDSNVTSDVKEEIEQHKEDSTTSTSKRTTQAKKAAQKRAEQKKSRK